MRSEKRGDSHASGGRRPNRRRRRGGFFYGLLTLLASIILWPVGMILLWRRRLRWSVSSKLLTTIISLFICVTLFGYGLTVQTDNVRITKAQDRVNDFLDNGAVYIADGYTAICDGAVRVWNSAVDLGDAASRASMVHTADALDQGVVLAGDAREALGNLFAQPEATEEPVPTEAPSAEPTAEVTNTPESTDVPEPTPTADIGTGVEVTGSGELPLIVPDETPDPDSAAPIGNGILSRSRTFVEVTATPTAEPTATPTVEPTATAEPTAEVTAEPTATVEPTDEPTAEPTATVEPTATAEVTATPEATVEATAEPTAEITSTPEATQSPVPTDEPEPTATPEPSPSPEVDPDLMPKPAGEAVVYYNPNGVNYHIASSCKNMKTASAGTLADAVSKGLRRCKNCGTPDASILEAECVVWVDEGGHFHLTDECADFTGTWSLMTLDDALAAGHLPCETCRADAFMAACGRTLPEEAAESPAPSAEPTPTVEPTPTAEPTATPEPTPSATPEPVVVTPSRALKPAGEALVYHSSNGGWYHTISNCSGMGGAKLYPLSECVDHYKRCRKCNAPLPELVNEHCLWMDETGLCHTTDECLSFEGKYTLITREDALAAGATGCKLCGADEYLQPGTVIAYPDE